MTFKHWSPGHPLFTEVRKLNLGISLKIMARNTLTTYLTYKQFALGRSSINVLETKIVLTKLKFS